MKRFIEGQDRCQTTLLPDCLDDCVGEDNPVRAVEAFIEELDLAGPGFAGVVPEAAGRPSYHPATLLKIYLYGYMNRIASSRRLERETQRNLELMWLTGRLMPDFKTIADFRRDNGPAIQATCRQFVLLCRRLKLFSGAVVAIDGSKFEAVNNRDKNYTPACQRCAIKARCTTGKERRVKRWEHEAVIDAMQQRLDRAPEAMRIRRQTVEHPFGTLKAWMGATHLLTRGLQRVSTEMGLQVLAYNLKRVISILGVAALLQAIRA